MTKKITKPKIEINLKQVEALAARGLTQQQIADSLGISESTLYTNKRENVDFAEAIKRGKAKGIATVTNKLFAKIEEGNLTATIFYLKTQAGWKETSVNEHISPDGSMTPKAVELTDDQLMRIASGKS